MKTAARNEKHGYSFGKRHFFLFQPVFFPVCDRSVTPSARRPIIEPILLVLITLSYVIISRNCLIGKLALIAIVVILGPPGVPPWTTHHPDIVGDPALNRLCVSAVTVVKKHTIGCELWRARWRSILRRKQQHGLPVHLLLFSLWCGNENCI